MGKYVAENTVKKFMIKADKPVKGSTVAIFEITFEENCPDVRNTKSDRHYWRIRRVWNKCKK